MITLASTALLKLRRNVYLGRHLIGTSQNMVKQGIRPLWALFSEPLLTGACRRTRDDQSKTGCELGMAKSSKVSSGGICNLFHPWKCTFRAMVKDANLSPEKEINYLRSYTKGDVQKVEINFQQWQYRHPVVALQDVWTELERHFGNSRHHKCSRATTLTHIEQGDKNKLPRFADVCAGLPSRPWVPKLSFRDWPHR